MYKREDAAIIQDIKEVIKRIISYTSKIEYKDFLKDYKTQDAVIRNIEILGEAVKLLSNNIDIVWDIAKNEIPFLSKQLKKALA